MLKRMTGLVLAGFMICAAVTLSAHDEYRIIGTVLKIAATRIDVKQTKDGKIIEIAVDKQTKVTKDKKPAAFNQIKVGGSVVVEALGDSLADLQALEIRLVPAIPATAKPK
jgi:hypothetical protein